MIEINLLPEELRRVEGTPLPRLLTICLGVAICVTLLFLNWFYFNETAKAKAKLKKVEKNLVAEKGRIKKLDKLIQKITTIKAHVSTIEDLYRERIIWAKVLFDLKHIVNQQEYNKQNKEREYIWFTDLVLGSKKVGGGMLGMPSQSVKLITIKGVASARGTRRATAMIRSLIDTMVSYKPEKSPEIEAVEEIEKTIKVRKAFEEMLKKKGKKGKVVLDQATKRKIRADNELIKHLQDKKSGGIAMMPFMNQFEGRRQLKIKWQDKMNASKSKDGKKFMPESGMKFELTLSFKPKKKKTVQPGF